ncbi:MAG: amino acid permease [Bacteroidales bacterium]|nr:amino acid permease [Bacteroidales bacterium]MCF8405912.1 amino acid permease [Bacteroidales bacterium]
MAKSNKFGAFGGVFTPSILTILGVIMYMRLPMIVGQAGLFATIGIIVVAHIISITTGLSVSSIATDKKVKAGGTYYIISRSLGLPIGGTLGLALFVGLSFSVSLYLIGFSESFLGFWGYDITINNIRIAGSIILFAVTVITFISTSLAVKTQYIIMTAIFLSLISIFFGNHDFTPTAPNLFGSESTVPLMVLFGIFFPAVTGFEAGVSMSGDLKDPKRSIPKGTIAAIAIGLVVYIILVFFLSYSVSSDLLANDPNALLKIAWIPELVVAGIWGATLSSALGSILAAPRILQATAVDRITPKLFARGTKATNEPRNAILITFFIAECGILIGELDVIARIVSVFFITTYGFLNLSSAFEAKTSADFRPDFKVPYWVGIIGAAACTLVMIQLDFLAMMGAIVILGLLYLFIKRKQLTLESGDAWSSVWASLVKTALQRLNISSIHTRNWRPNIIMFSGDAAARPHLTKSGIDLAGKLGMISGFELEPSKDQILIKNKRTLLPSTDSSQLTIHTHQCRDVLSGIDEIVRTYGFTGVEPNTILMGWSRKEANRESWINLLRNFQRNNFNSIFLNYDPVKKFGKQRTIDVWWSGWGTNLVFSIYLMRHLTSVGEWKDSSIRLLVIHKDPKLVEKIHKTIARVLDQYRINLAVKVIDNSIDNYHRDDIISRESANTDLTVIGFPWKQNQKLEVTYEQTNHLSGLIGTSLFINACSTFEEVDLGLEKRIPGQKELSEKKEVLDVPDLRISKYEVINENLSKIDTNGQKVLESFFDKTFLPYFLENNQFLSEVNGIIQASLSGFSKIQSQPDFHKKQKSLKAGRSDFYFHTNKALEKFIEKVLPSQRESLEAGIFWYIQKLENELSVFPQYLLIDHDREDFKIKKKDPFGLKLTKFKKRALHLNAKKTIPVYVKFRDVASYYLRDNRFQFMLGLLKKFEKDCLSTMSKLRPLITEMDGLISKVERQVQEKGFQEEPFKKERDNIIETSQGIIKEFELLQEIYRSRLFVEFRKNLIALSVNLEKANINRYISIKRRSRKYYRLLKINNGNFPEEFYAGNLYYFNKILLDVMLKSHKHRIEDKLEKLTINISRSIESGLMKNLELINKEAQKIVNDPKRIAGFKLDFNDIEESTNLTRGFENLREEIVDLGNNLPENLLISSGNNLDEQTKKETQSEVIDIPLRKIALHFIETRFLNSTYELLEKNSVKIKKTIFLIKDQLSFARFSLENINESVPDKKLAIEDIIQQSLAKINKDAATIKLIKDDLRPSIQAYLEEAFEPLFSYKIPGSAVEFSSFVREYQSRKVRNRVEAKGLQIKDFIRKKSARLLYSKSEGILLARQLMENSTLKSVTENLLDFVEKVSPKQNVMETLPHYYKNLFSGRSSISDDFWIGRSFGEALFSKAVKRFQSGFKGGVLVLGERNSGKTAFCRHIAKQHFADDKIYQLFRSQEDSVTVEDFTVEVRKITGLNGNLYEIFETLPSGSIFIIHDLELWWERSQEGYQVINKVAKLINEFAHKCLFVINMNPFAYKVINSVTKIEDNFISIISSMPFDSEEIKEMIIRRHHSSGLKFRLQNTDEESISEFKLAGLFNKYFDSTNGNPGVALNRWLTNIEKFSGETIYISYPKSAKSEILENLDDDWQVILIQLILHKRMTIQRLTKILDLDFLEVEEMMDSIRRTGLITEKSNGVYMINAYAEPYLTYVFKQKGLL